MHAKIAFLILAGFLIGAVLLGLRQQRIAAARDLVELHRQIEQTRRQLWSAQAAIAREVQPQALRRVLADSPDLIERSTSTAQVSVAAADDGLTAIGDGGGVEN